MKQEFETLETILEKVEDGQSRQDHNHMQTKILSVLPLDNLKLSNNLWSHKSSSNTTLVDSEDSTIKSEDFIAQKSDISETDIVEVESALHQVEDSLMGLEENINMVEKDIMMSELEMTHMENELLEIEQLSNNIQSQRSGYQFVRVTAKH